MESLPLFQNYYWKNGKPIPFLKGNASDGFKVISDPYKKRYSIEKYSQEKPPEIIYDSYLFDFRHLALQETDAWHREPLDDSRSLIRNIDDRIIMIEEAFFEESTCTSCHFFSPHGILVAIQKIYPNHVILSDITGRPILEKHYETDESGTFTSLLLEINDFSPIDK